MAEGAIEGEARMYQVASPYATNFAFSRFDWFDEQEQEEAQPRLAGGRGQDASAGEVEVDRR